MSLRVVQEKARIRKVAVGICASCLTMQAYEHQSTVCVLITKLVHSAIHFTLILLTQEHAFLLQPKQTIKLTHFILINLKNFNVRELYSRHFHPLFYIQFHLHPFNSLLFCQPILLYHCYMRMHTCTHTHG